MSSLNLTDVNCTRSVMFNWLVLHYPNMVTFWLKVAFIIWLALNVFLSHVTCVALGAASCFFNFTTAVCNHKLQQKFFNHMFPQCCFSNFSLEFLSGIHETSRACSGPWIELQSHNRVCPLCSCCCCGSFKNFATDFGFHWVTIHSQHRCSLHPLQLGRIQLGTVVHTSVITVHPCVGVLKTGIVTIAVGHTAIFADGRF